jgi:outer membrane protein
MFNKEILVVQESQFKITKEDAKRTKELIDAGVKVKSDILEIEATLATQEQSLVQAKNNLRLTKINLA